MGKLGSVVIVGMLVWQAGLTAGLAWTWSGQGQQQTGVLCEDALARRRQAEQAMIGPASTGRFYGDLLDRARQQRNAAEDDIERYCGRPQ